MPVSIASFNDIPAMTRLMNSAYRGEGSKKGWTTEADLVEGDLRTDEAHLHDLMQQPGSVFLISTNEENEIMGCVFLQKRKGKLYLGMLSVSPALQTRGTGKQLMAEAERYAKQQACTGISMRVISTRHELIAWYERQGFSQTGEFQPFENSRFGTAKGPIQFVLMEKIF